MHLSEIFLIKKYKLITGTDVYPTIVFLKRLSNSGVSIAASK